METITFLPFLMVILSILFGIGGIALLVIGLIFSQKKKWIPGLVAFVFAVIIGIAGIVFSFRNVIEKINQNKSNFYHKNIENTVNADSLFRHDSPVDSNYIDPVSGFIEDKDQNLIFFKIYPHKNIYEAEFTLLKVNKGKTGAQKQVAVEITMDSKKAFTGQLDLSFFAQDQKFIGESVVTINVQPSSNLQINFPFDTKVDFSKADYGTLRIIEQ